MSDAAAIAAVNSAASAELIERHPGLVYVAEAGRSVVGYLALQNETHPAVGSRNPLQLWQIYVIPSFHGAGTAAKFMAAAMDHARRHSHNARAIAFYRKHGFNPLGLHRVGAGYHEHEDVLMSCKVN